jgi:hypothetical protein
MSIEEVKGIVRTWSRLEQEDFREWLENLLEDRLEMTDEFKGRIEAGFAEIEEGKGRFDRRRKDSIQDADAQNQ